MARFVFDWYNCVEGSSIIEAEDLEQAIQFLHEMTTAELDSDILGEDFKIAEWYELDENDGVI